MLKLDYVSPLPPVRSGIADYSTDLLPHLAERADVRVLALPGQPVSEEIVARWRPVPAAEALAEGEAEAGRDESGAPPCREGGPPCDEARLPLYQMGNNPHHDAVWDLALKHPGVLTLHDLVLHHLLAHRTLGQGRYEPYREALTADHGWIGREAARMRYWRLEDDASLFGLPAHRGLLLRQRGVLVHNRWAAERILEDSPELRVKVVPMGIPLPADADRSERAAAAAELRRSWGVPEGAPLLGSFGFQTPIKRTGSVIRALADRRLASVHLVIVGESSPGLDLAAEAREAGVADRVHVAGFVPYEAFEAAIAAVDLTLNLRYPTAGETSASLLRILALGRPAVVSDYGQFAELPDDVVVKVPLPGAIGAGAVEGEGEQGSGEPRALAAELSRLLAAPEALAAMGRAARQHVAREHDPARAAEALVEACTEWRDAPPLEGPRPEASPSRVAYPAPASLPPTSPPPSSLVWPELPGEIRVEGAEAPWRPGERRRLTVHLTNTGEARWLAASRGPGGLALELALEAGEGYGEPHRPWIPLPRDLAPGESASLSVDLRRPPGPARLHLAARVLDAPAARTAALSLDLPLRS